MIEEIKMDFDGGGCEKIDLVDVVFVYFFFIVVSKLNCGLDYFIDVIKWDC